LRYPFRKSLALVAIVLALRVVYAVAQAPRAATGVFVSAPPASGFTCNQTFSSTTGLATAIGSAANGSTICITGNVGSFSLSSTGRSGYVTVRSTSAPLGGTFTSLTVADNQFVKWQDLNIGGVAVNPCARNVQWIGDNFTAAWGMNWGATNCLSFRPYNILIDSSTFGNPSPAFDDGTVDIRDCDSGAGCSGSSSASMGITISNNVFHGTASCLSDGVHFGGSNIVAVNINHNTFWNLQDDLGGVHTGEHCDSIQNFADTSGIIIDSNWFRDSAVVLQWHITAGTIPGTVFTNNVMSNVVQMQAGQCDGCTFDHNTFWNSARSFTDGVHTYAILTDSINTTFRDNILTGTTGNWTGLSSTGDVVSFLLCDSLFQGTGGMCWGGTNLVLGPPTFVGGSNPATFTSFSQFKLTSGSAGHNAGHDGKDMGAVIP
jgi:hypothetical protein